jgi:hypothetical protein
MTEAEWLACTDPLLMLEFLRGNVSDRKLRWFACACIWDYLRMMGETERGLARAVLVYERYVDGIATRKDWWENTAQNWHFIWQSDADAFYEARRAAMTASHTAGWHKAEANKFNDAEQQEHNLHECQQLRDIVRDPFRPSILDPLWSNTTVSSLARAAYDCPVPPTRTLDNIRLMILADALEDAGCTEAHLLHHLRSPGPHVRGCWALDLALGKE